MQLILYHENIGHILKISLKVRGFLRPPVVLISFVRFHLSAFICPKIWPNIRVAHGFALCKLILWDDSVALEKKHVFTWLPEEGNRWWVWTQWRAVPRRDIIILKSHFEAQKPATMLYWKSMIPSTIFYYTVYSSFASLTLTDSYCLLIFFESEGRPSASTIAYAYHAFIIASTNFA